MKRNIPFPRVKKKPQTLSSWGIQVGSICGCDLERLCDLNQSFDFSGPWFPQHSGISNNPLDASILWADCVSRIPVD